MRLFRQEPNTPESPAVRYVTGEMPDRERAAFEARLQVDANLRDLTEMLRRQWELMVQNDPRLGNPFGLDVADAA